MKYAQIRALIANPGEHVFWNHTYVICNEFGPVAIAYANCASDALDEAADAGKLGVPMDWDEVEEDRADLFDDGISLLGNASEPYWTAYTSITELNR